ncbi:MAG: holo-ACP synthase [Alphaproteobacteria bacterium]|nr:holo-ACP synthase [Alphaproteobacteria bacterium]
MILGVGADLVDIRRVAVVLERHGDRFTHRCFTATERARADRRPHARAASYAKRFAAKEACAKALGTGLRRDVFWRDMGVVNLPGGQPTMALTRGAAQRLASLVPPRYKPVIHVSLSDDDPWAQAFVVISAIGENE